MMAAISASAAVNLELDVQIAPEIQEKSLWLPDQSLMEQWILLTLSTAKSAGDKQLTVRIVDEAEIKTLNETYRHKPGVTNILSFPFEAPPDVPIPLLEELLGDIVICAPSWPDRVQPSAPCPWHIVWHPAGA